MIALSKHLRVSVMGSLLTLTTAGLRSPSVETVWTIAKGGMLMVVIGSHIVVNLSATFSIGVTPLYRHSLLMNA